MCKRRPISILLLIKNSQKESCIQYIIGRLFGPRIKMPFNMGWQQSRTTLSKQDFLTSMQADKLFSDQLIETVRTQSDLI